jgi:hypothetical protein
VVGADLDFFFPELSIGVLDFLGADNEDRLCGLEDFPPTLFLRAEEAALVASGVAGGSWRCFVVGGGASDFFFPEPSLFGVPNFLGADNEDRLCGLTALLGFLLVGWGLMVVLLLIGLEPLVCSLSLPLPVDLDLPTALDLLLLLDDAGIRIDLDAGALVVSSLGLSSFTPLA